MAYVGIWAQGALTEIAPDIVLYTYGARGPGAGGEPWNVRTQKMKVAAAAEKLIWCGNDDCV